MAKLVEKRRLMIVRDTNFKENGRQNFT